MTSPEKAGMGTGEPGRAEEPPGRGVGDQGRGLVIAAALLLAWVALRMLAGCG